MAKFIVPIVYTGLWNYIVEADTAEQAIEKAEDEYANGDDPPMIGNEWEEIDHIGTVEKLPGDKKKRKRK